MQQTLKSFYFNATAYTPGSFNITVSIQNITGATLTNITITVNDTTKPTIEYDSSMAVNGANLSQTYLVYNITTADNLALHTVVVRLFNSTGNQVNSSNTTTTSPFEGNFTGLAEGIYYLNVTANDTTGNANGTSYTMWYRLDTTNPSVTFSCTPTTVTVTSRITCSCSGSDSGGSGLASTEYTEYPNTNSPGTLSTTCTVKDKAGNTGTASVTYTVNSGGGSASSSSSGAKTSSKSSGKSSTEKELEETSKTGSTSQTGTGASGKALLSGTQKTILIVLVIVLVVLIVGWFALSKKQK
jgi:hypothetical protein